MINFNRLIKNTQRIAVLFAVCCLADTAMANSVMDKTPLEVRVAQNTQNQLRSRSEVVAEVKQRHKAKVLKISLNQKKTAYNVRVLMPSGKVRNLTINARR